MSRGQAPPPVQAPWMLRTRQRCPSRPASPVLPWTADPKTQLPSGSTVGSSVPLLTHAFCQVPLPTCSSALSATQAFGPDVTSSWEPSWTLHTQAGINVPLPCSANTCLPSTCHNQKCPRFTQRLWSTSYEFGTT